MKNFLINVASLSIALGYGFLPIKPLGLVWWLEFLIVLIVLWLTHEAITHLTRNENHSQQKIDQ